MIVHCDQCKSKFRLDDAKVKDAGVKVRCSKCRHVFMVFPEQPKEDSEFDDLLRGFGPAAGAAMESPGQEGGFFVQEQESSPASDGVPFATDESYADQTTPAADGYSFGDLSPDDETAGDKPGAELPGDDFRGSSFDFSSLLEEQPAAPAEEAAQQDFQGLDVFDNLGFTSDGPTSVDSDQDANPAMQEDDLSPSDSFPFTAPVVAAEDKETDIVFPDAADVPVVPEFAEAFTGTAAEEPKGEEGKQSLRDELAATELPSVPSTSRRRQHSVFPLIVTAISIIFVLLLAAGGLLFMKGGPKLFERFGLGFLPQLMGLQAEDEGNVSIRGMTGVFLQNDEAGEIFVVSGEAVNGFRKPRAAIQVRALLYGPDGSIVSRRLAYCGNRLTSEQLKTLPIAKIESAMNNQFGDSLSNLGIAPGKGIPFVVVFTKVPANTASYGVEVAGSTVAGK